MRSSSAIHPECLEKIHMSTFLGGEPALQAVGVLAALLLGSLSKSETHTAPEHGLNLREVRFSCRISVVHILRGIWAFLMSLWMFELSNPHQSQRHHKCSASVCLQGPTSGGVRGTSEGTSTIAALRVDTYVRSVSSSCYFPLILRMGRNCWRKLCCCWISVLCSPEDGGWGEIP